MPRPAAILVPLDGSPFAEQALPLAARLAKTWGAKLRLVSVHVPVLVPTWGDPAAGASLYNPELDGLLRNREEAYLRQVADSLASQNIEIECLVLEGLIPEAIENCIRGTKSDLVIMTSHGRGGLARAVLGSVADQLIRRLEIPVLLFPPETNYTRAIPLRRRILVPLDGSALAESAIEPARDLASAMDAELMLVTVLHPLGILFPSLLWPTTTATEAPEEREPFVRQYLETWQNRLRNEGFLVEIRIRTASKVAGEILRIAKDEECSLLTMSTHGAGGVDRLMLGSVADQVLRHTDVPVMVFRGPIRDPAQGRSPTRTQEPIAIGGSSGHA